MRRALILPLVLLLAGFLTACDSSDPDPVQNNPALSGQWRGTATVQGSTLTVNLQIVENNGVVNGNGTITLANPVAVSATGTYNFPSVALTIRSSGLEDLNFTGTLGADGRSLSGSMSGSGFDNFAITLSKQ
jgi:hypothetical protein